MPVGTVIRVQTDEGEPVHFRVIEDLGVLPDGRRQVRVECVESPDCIAILAVGVVDPAHLN